MELMLWNWCLKSPPNSSIERKSKSVTKKPSLWRWKLNVIANLSAKRLKNSSTKKWLKPPKAILNPLWSLCSHRTRVRPKWKSALFPRHRRKVSTKIRRSTLRAKPKWRLTAFSSAWIISSSLLTLVISATLSLVEARNAPSVSLTAVNYRLTSHSIRNCSGRLVSLSIKTKELRSCLTILNSSLWCSLRGSSRSSVAHTLWSRLILRTAQPTWSTSSLTSPNPSSTCRLITSTSRR